MLKTEIKGGDTPVSACVFDGPCGGVLSIISPTQVFGTFKATTHAAAGTTAIVTPDGGGSIAVTDIIITSEKKTSGTITLSFTDGTNSVGIIGYNASDAPIQLAVSVAGRFAGWEDARIDLVTVEDFDVTVTVGYMKIPSSHTIGYSEWDALR